jgi:hypothetical protein
MITLKNEIKDKIDVVGKIYLMLLKTLLCLVRADDSMAIG